MNVRHLEFFAAVARERHFGRAATACHVSQPALSAAIGRLEDELGIRLVERGGRTTVGLTEAGDLLLPRARAAVQNLKDLRAEAGSLRGHLHGTLRLGVVPTGVAVAPTLVAELVAAQPGVRVRITTASAAALSRAVLHHELDAALVYDDVPPPGLASRPLYRERYVLLSGLRAKGAPASVSWRAVADEPLCLLSPQMQQRSILDEVFRSAGIEVRPRIEADSFSLLLGFVRRGWSTVIGHTWLPTLGDADVFRAQPIVDPGLRPAMSLVVPAGEPRAPVTKALMETLNDAEVEQALHAT